jgi:cytochrome c biogenesis protein CcmG/thiol:disulfide interchange protein DsbE
MDYGVYGAPETYIIDKSGTVRLKHVGRVTQDIWNEKILPLVQELNRQ